MIADVFLDTDILVYAAIGTGKDTPKRERALMLIETEPFATSAQVLQEFFVTVTRKAVRPLSAEQAMDWVEELIAFPVTQSITGWFVSPLNLLPVTESPTGMQPFFLRHKLWDATPSTPRT